MSPATRQGILALAVCLAVLIGTGLAQDFFPDRFRVFIPPAELLPEELQSLAARTGSVEHQGGRPSLALSRSRQAQAQTSPVSQKILEAGPGDAYLKPFFARLAELENGANTIVRVIHFGDSVNWGDNVTGRVKQLLQKEFGDGGRGLVHAMDTPPMSLLEHSNLTRGGFVFEQLPYVWFHFTPLPRLGFMAESFRPAYNGAFSAHAAPANAAPWETARVILRDARKPGTKGELEPYSVEVRAYAQGAAPGTYEWTSRESAVRLEPGDCDAVEIPLPPTRAAQVHFKRADGPFIDGIALETKRGVSYSSIVRMGVHMAWKSAIPYENRACGFKAYRPDLVIQQFGTNESASLDGYRAFNATLYRAQFKKYLEETRRMLPGVPVLVFGPYERMVASPRGLVASASHGMVRSIQREVAAELQMPYFDSYLAFGGPGHMAGLVARGLAQNDYMHLAFGGGNILGTSFHAELSRAYARFRGRAAGAGAETSGGANTPAPGESDLAQTKDVADGSSAIQFHSRAFAYFLGLVLLFGNFFLRWPRLRLVFLVLASYYFYATWKFWPLGLILLSSAIDYGAALAIHAARARGGRGNGFLVFSLLANLGLLFFFKYFDFLAGAIGDLMAFMGATGRPPALGLLLPVGISFYTFQTMSYTIDVWRGELEVERSPWRFMLYVTFFPQLVAGPIVRAKNFLPDITRRIRHFPVDSAALGAGLFLIFAGLLKKTGADWIAVNVVDRVYLDPSRFTSLEMIAAIYGYGLQIYGDFSGYTDIALGSAMLLGFRLAENFRRPYQAASLSEFWRRWHISLGSWFRDYVYIPLGGNRRRIYSNLLITMFLVGLWHGAGWNFIFWGLFNAAVLMGERWLGIGGREGAGGPWRGLRVLLTLHIVLAGWVLFRVQDGTTASALRETLLRGDFRLPNVTALALAFIALAYAYHFTPINWRERLREFWAERNGAVQGLVAAAVILLVYNTRAPTVQPYIYFQF